MSATLTSRRRLATLGVVWFAFAFAPELALSSSPKPLGHGAVGALVYALTAVASLLTWWLLVAGIAALRARSRALGWVAVGIVGPVGTFLTVASVHYRWFFGTDVRPIAIAYLIEYPEYALTLVSHSLTWGARAALFGGAAFGIVVLGALTTYAAQLTTVMTKPVADAAALSALLADQRFSALLLGPGLGVGAATRALVAAALAAARPTVLDADALTSFASDRQELLGALRPNCVLTPHDGEFARLFDAKGDRLSRALAASRACNAVVLLKGADTVVAAPDGRASIQGEAPPALATAGTGDVLAGLIAGLLAQGVPAFEAAAAAVWLHAEAARRAGPGLIAEELGAHLAAALAAARQGP